METAPCALCLQDVRLDDLIEIRTRTNRIVFVCRDVTACHGRFNARREREALR